MHADLSIIEKQVYSPCKFRLSHFTEEIESKEYSAAAFVLNELRIKLRVAKTTPAKVGQFVTLWKRNKAGITKPYDISDEVDIVVICTRKNNQLGQFVFPKSILVDQGIFSISGKGGKRGFRVYPPWDLAPNKQAHKTQQWQLNFFLEILDLSVLNLDRAKILYSKAS